jgi:hypothetical protein
MTYDGGRSLDDLPLAAYGGSGMELSVDDEAKLDTVPSPDSETAPVEASPIPPGPFAHATGPDAPLLGEPLPRRALPVVLVGLATRVLTLLRTSRPAAGAAFGLVIVVGLVVLLGGGQNPGAAGADASPSAAPIPAATREPGNATLVLTGEVEQEVTFTTSTGEGSPSAPLQYTWTNVTANTLGLTGPVDRGTRSTGETLVLHWTVLIDDKPVTFTSTEGECTLGMGVVGTRVQGTFTCKKLKSDDGDYVVEATGTYRT